MAETKDIAEMSFESALQELETIVRELESGQSGLEDSIARYERGVALKKHCDKKLNEAQAKIEKIHVQEDGRITTEELDETPG